jgi:hypothetical protein
MGMAKINITEHVVALMPVLSVTIPAMMPPMIPPIIVILYEKPAAAVGMIQYRI